MNNLKERLGVFRPFLLVSILLVVFYSVTASWGSEELTVNSSLFKNMSWRSIGPAVMGGRMVDIEAVTGNPHIIYLGSASSGIWKSVNGGISFYPIFDDQPVHAIGDIAIAPSNPNVLWVGTGEGNARDSVSCGNGVYRSLDAGVNWEHMGLDDTRFISEIVIHPKNPDIVYVAAIGHIWGSDENRGVYMTTNGGKTWKQVLYIDEETGISDLDMDPSNPNILYAGAWTFQRHSWTHRSGSERGGVFKSIDKGLTWKKMTHRLPALIGRIGVRVAPSNPNVVYAIMECKEGTLFRSNNKGENWRKVSDDWNIVMRGFYYAELHVDPQDENHIYALANSLSVSEDGGKTFRRIRDSGLHGDWHGMWIDPQDPNYMIIGNDGGCGISYDGDKTWDRLNTMPHGQFYRIDFNLDVPFYKVAGGMQDNSTWIGPVRSRCSLGILNDDWVVYCGGDGFYPVFHHKKPLFICEGQCGRMSRIDLTTGQGQSISPSPFPSQALPAEDLPYRFAWNTPIVASPHDPDTIYLGGNVLFRSRDFGTKWEIISPDLTTDNPEKQKPAGGPIAIEGTGAEYHCTIRTISESPARKNVIWVGTDDGLVHVTRNGGKDWTDVTQNIPNIEPEGYVTNVESSRFDVASAYITYDRHMLDDIKPYVFKTNDFGETWENITGNLPSKGYAHIIREDPQNPQLLYIGTEYGLYVSFCGGKNWISLEMKNLPTVSIRDLKVHPKENDLILGTHGRSFYIFDDITFLQEISNEILVSDIYLFNPRKAWRYSLVRNKATTGGGKAFRGPNPDYGALLTYYLKSSPDEKTSVNIEVLDSQGNLVKELEGTKRAGMNRVAWALCHEGPTPRHPEEHQIEGRGRFTRGPQALPGKYTVKLVVGSKEMSKQLHVEMDPALEVSMSALEAQWKNAMELRDMLSSLNLALRNLDMIESQCKKLLKKIEKNEEIPDAAKKEIGELLDKATYMREHMSREGRNFNWTPGYILGKVSSLFSMIDGANNSPTIHQLDFLEEVRVEFRKSLDDFNGLIIEDIPALNQVLQRHDLDIILTGETIE
jgi:hypothetical protein